MWRYSAAKAVGTSHTKVGQVCQDRFACTTTGSGYLVIAVADGAGTASKAEVGAELATSTAVTTIRDAINIGETDLLDIVRSAVEVARNRLIEEAASQDANARDLACTLLLGAFGPDGGAAAQIGDGLIAVKLLAHDWAWVFWPQHGEFVNETNFLTDTDAMSVVESSRVSADVRDIAVMTDGLEPLAIEYASRSAHQNFFEGMLKPLRTILESGEATDISGQLEQFLDSPRRLQRRLGTNWRSRTPCGTPKCRDKRFGIHDF